MPSDRSSFDEKKLELQQAVRRLYLEALDKYGGSGYAASSGESHHQGVLSDKSTVEQPPNNKLESAPAFSSTLDAKLHTALEYLRGMAAWGTIFGFSLSIFFASFLATQDNRHEQDVLTAWRTITSAAGQSGDGGRKDALEFLVSQPLRFPLPCRSGRYPICLFYQPAENLSGLDLGLDDNEARERSGTGAFLESIELPNARLTRANLQDANLFLANLQNAHLFNANLQNTDLSGANLQDTNLNSANFQDADLTLANLQNARLQDAYLRDADLRSTNLQDTQMFMANFQAADLSRATLQNTDLELGSLQNAFLLGTNLRGANLIRTNLQNADFNYSDLRDADLREANLQHAVLQNTNLQGANLRRAFHTTNETSLDTCSEIFKASHPDIGEEELQAALNESSFFPCPTLWEGSVYDDYTAAHPPDTDFDFEAAGMIHIDSLSPEELCEYDWYQPENECPEEE